MNPYTLQTPLPSPLAFSHWPSLIESDHHGTQLPTMEVHPLPLMARLCPQSVLPSLYFSEVGALQFVKPQRLTGQP